VLDYLIYVTSTQVTDVMFVKLLEKVQGSLQSAEDKRMAIITELTAKHQKVRAKNSGIKFRELTSQKNVFSKLS
jgi:hypothetical protein